MFKSNFHIANRNNVSYRQWQTAWLNLRGIDKGTIR